MGNNDIVVITIEFLSAGDRVGRSSVSGAALNEVQSVGSDVTTIGEDLVVVLLFMYQNSTKSYCGENAEEVSEG